MPAPARKHRTQGFTLIELMVTLAIVGIATSVAIPSFRSLVLESRLTSEANDMLGSLKFTRSEAVKRNARVTMCRSDDGTACAVSGAASASWQGGWIVFVDGGVVGTVEPTDQILRVRGALPTTKLVGNGNVVNFVSYVGNGQTSAAAGGAQVGVFSLCTPLASETRRKITVSQGSGWVGVTKVAAAAECTS